MPHTYIYGIAWLWLLLAAGVPQAWADDVLTAGNLNASLKEMQRTVRSQTPSGAGDATFELARQADKLANLLSDEVAAHGLQQEQLLQLAVDRCRGLGIGIDWSEEHARYFYDASAYRDYLAAHPEGKHAADSLFALIQHDFYLADAGNARDLASAVERKRQMLSRFPDYPGADKVRLYLGIDYRDLWRISRERGNDTDAARWLFAARKQLQDLEAGEGIESNIAAGLLRRLREESADADADRRSSTPQNSTDLP